MGLRTASACCWLCTFHCLTCFVQERRWGGRGEGEGGRGKGDRGEVLFVMKETGDILRLSVLC